MKHSLKIKTMLISVVMLISVMTVPFSAKMINKFEKFSFYKDSMRIIAEYKANGNYSPITYDLADGVIESDIGPSYLWKFYRLGKHKK